MNDKKILIIYTGGTIGMIDTDKGYAPDKDSFHKYLSEMPELRSPKMPKWDIVDMDPLLDSSNVAVKEWNMIGEEIAKHYDKYDGFVILHGTDTMAYTASALSFMMENNRKPIIITGSQIPLCEIRNDARVNLITSIIIAAEAKVNEVCLYFGGRLLRGNRATKISSDGMIAFESPNHPHLADVGVQIWYNDAILGEENDFLSDKAFHFQPMLEQQIGVIKVFPGMRYDLFEPIMTKDLKALVVEAFGAGNIPNNGDDLLPLIRKSVDNDIVLVVCSQCLKGSVLLGTYEASDGLLAAGAISGNDITSEGAVAKLYYLFSKGYDVQSIRELMHSNLRGETSPR